MLYNEAERQVFGPYFNGEKLAYADPIRVHRHLNALLDGEVNKYLERSRSEDLAERFNAEERLLPAVVKALNMVPFDPDTGTGALEQDVRAALRAYLEFMDGKKGMGPTSPTYSLPSQDVGPLASGSITVPTSPFGVIYPESASSGPGK